jgi:hypothetical protein
MTQTLKEIAVIIGIILLIGIVGNMEYADAIACAIG